VKTPLPPLTAIAGADTANQPVPLDIVAVGVIVTLPEQAPITPTVNFCGAGFEPASAVKINVGAKGGCSVHTGCIVNVIGMTLGVPTANLVTLSIAAMVTEPEYVPAISPVDETPTLVAVDPLALTNPVGFAVSHVPPAGVTTELFAVQVRAFAQAPLVVITRG